MFTGLFEIGFSSPAVALDGKAGQWPVEAQHLFDFTGTQHGFATAEVPADQFYWQTAAQHDSRSLGIAPYVVLRSRGYVSFAARGAAHDYAAADLLGDVALAAECQSNIGKRPQGHEDKSRVGFDDRDDGVYGMFFFWRPASCWIAVITQSVAAVEPVSAFVRARERLFSAGIDRNVRAAELGGVERVSRGLQHRHISGDRGDGQHAHGGRAESHDECNGVVGSSIGIDQEERLHAA